MSEPEFESALIALLPNLYRFALRLSRKGDLAEDLVQIAVERALATRETYDPALRLEPWLIRILRNAWIDMTRRSKTRGVELDVYDTPDAAVVDGARVTEQALMLDATERAMATLPEDQREILLLVCYQELSYAETAEILDIPKGTVMSRLSRARKALSEKLGIN
ncbi:RNA polymerase sigma factor [Tritonibacter mobilis]|uniref:RNA polymerase sigma factor n=1 Tax=Tritonibacter mobilis TaxID=379347 RepID=UPI0014039CFF|nr:RNA polymerase sigma factor [Tritonibacter mobilis]NHM18527.1 RNA polymerase sigma factor [Tritonibacter mobilis]NHM22624.1 RNA polymerase sigma factor [Tritonibacter mobilis]